MNNKELINKTELFVKQMLGDNSAGHDWFHIDRVRKTSLALAEKIPCDKFIVELAALLHDIADYKFHDGNDKLGGETAEKWLRENELNESAINTVVEIINGLSFKGANVDTKLKSIEGQIVQDADRLDAIGAIGIARAFAYGGYKNRLMYDPKIKSNLHNSFDEYKKNTSPTINHFYEKLLLLKNLMNTNEAKKIAGKRHKVMEDFLEQFYIEWDAKDI